MEKIIKAMFIAVISVFALYIILLSLAPANSSANSLTLANLKLPKAAATAIDSYTKKAVNIDTQPLRDNPNIYQYDAPGSIVTIYVTVRKGSPSDNANFTWSQINDFTSYFFTNSPDINIKKAD